MLTDKQLESIRHRNDEAEAALLRGSIPALLIALGNSQKDVTALLKEVDRYHDGDDE